MISWSANDDSLFKNGIMKTSGQVILGTTALTQYDYQREAYNAVRPCRWSCGTRQVRSGIAPSWTLGHRSTSLVQRAAGNVDIGVSLLFGPLPDNVDAFYDYSPTELVGGQLAIQNISQASTHQ